MPYDGLVTKSVCNELNKTLTLGKIDKIIQPTKDSVILFIRNSGFTYKLLLSANAQNCSTYITNRKKIENPQKPFNFCMVLRKYLQGAKLINITQPNNDRILNFTFENSNELGDKEIRILIIEMMGKYSNIILTNQSDLILDSLKHVDFEISSIREVMPGRTYLLPPCQEKLNPFKITELDFNNVMKDRCTLNSKFIGISSLVSKELTNNSYILFSEFINKPVTPTVFFNKNQPVDFYFTSLSSFDKNIKIFDTLSEAIDFYFSYKLENEKLENAKQLLTTVISHIVAKTEKKLSIVNEKLETTKDMESIRVEGELLSANLYKITPYSKEITVENYYSNQPVTITLNPNLTPAQNAQKIFKKYTKLKNTYSACSKQKDELLLDLKYFETLFFEIYSQEHIEDLEDIKQELIDEGIIKLQKNKKNKNTLSVPITILFSGFEILVGKNNIQNDNLTFHIASKNDIWLHVKNAPGSHTIIRSNNTPVPQFVLEKAASIAAFHSKLKNSPKADVDYTLVKNVKKIPGAKPGMVIYDNFKTIYIEPCSSDII